MNATMEFSKIPVKKSAKVKKSVSRSQRKSVTHMNVYRNDSKLKLDHTSFI